MIIKVKVYISHVPHVLLTNENTDSWSAREAPILADKVQLRFDVIDEQGHVVRQVKVAHLEHERVAQHSLATHAVHLNHVTIT